LLSRLTSVEEETVKKVVGKTTAKRQSRKRKAPEDPFDYGFNPVNNWRVSVEQYITRGAELYS